MEFIQLLFTMDLGLSLIITLALFIGLNLIAKNPNYAFNSICSLWWGFGGLYWGLKALGWEYFQDNGGGIVLFLLLYGLFWLIVTIGMILFTIIGRDLTDEQLAAEGRSFSKAFRRCPKCLKKIPSYFTIKCPHCTADI
jgi:hypothetical protein